MVSCRCQIKVLEDRYHAEEEERINKQVSMEIELEKKQNQLNKAYKELEKVQTEVLQVRSVLLTFSGGLFFQVLEAACECKMFTYVRARSL